MGGRARGRRGHRSHLRYVPGAQAVRGDRHASDDWEELSEVIGIETPGTLKDRILALDEDQRFIVCDSGVELVASPSRVLASDDDFASEPGGQWVVTDDAGNVVSRFADWLDGEP